MIRCVGCKTCQAACKDKNGLNCGHFFRRVITLPAGDGGLPANYSGMCGHCERPACADGCEVGAMRKNEDGTVSNDQSKCIGCGACVWNCPNGAPKLSELNGVSQKCNSCADLREKGRKPMCVDACPTFALDFGDIHELEKTHGPDIIRHPPTQTNSQTDPSIIVKIAPTWKGACRKS